ncbi:hypothetical protein AA313_de0209460 [Arthrobotrys entomopaga]|nr:hypothetical protein AA313_de0209460 [Arthrobotrys entomopaga]
MSSPPALLVVTEVIAKDAPEVILSDLTAGEDSDNFRAAYVALALRGTGLKLDDNVGKVTVPQNPQAQAEGKPDKAAILGRLKALKEQKRDKVKKYIESKQALSASAHQDASEPGSSSAPDGKGTENLKAHKLTERKFVAGLPVI